MKNARQCHPKMLIWHLTIFFAVICIISLLFCFAFFIAFWAFIGIITGVIFTGVIFTGIVFTRVIFTSSFLVFASLPESFLVRVIFIGIILLPESSFLDYLFLSESSLPGSSCDRKGCVNNAGVFPAPVIYSGSTFLHIIFIRNCEISACRSVLSPYVTLLFRL